MEKKTYQSANGIVNSEQAAQIAANNEKIWDEFWAIPAKDRTPADWKKLLDVQFLVKR